MRVTCSLKWGKEIRKGNEIQYEMYIKDKNVKEHEVLPCHTLILARVMSISECSVTALSHYDYNNIFIFFTHICKYV